VGGEAGIFLSGFLKKIKIESVVKEEGNTQNIGN
jgi:hypothetical protein